MAQGVVPPSSRPLGHRSEGRADADGMRPAARHAIRSEGGLRFVLLTVLGLIPGAGLLAAGRRVLGGILLGLTLAAVALGVAVVLGGTARERALDLAVSPDSLLVIAAVAVAVGLVWAASIALTGWAARPQRSHRWQRVLGTAFVGLLSLAVLAPGAFAARYALIQRDVVQSVFGGGGQVTRVGGIALPRRQAADPWKDTPRVNVLLLGSDAGADRTGVRTDSMIVASIDTKTGRTTLLGLPRSLQKVPFPASNPLHQVWPNGFNCGNQCLLNAVWEQAEQRKDLFKGDPHPGLTTVRGVIGEILGLRLDYYTILDLQGFSGLVDAMGGVVVNVPREIPIGGGHNLKTGALLPIHGYVHKGRHRLNGREALWFARSREGSDDYDRMRRQRCMVGALLDQSNPMQLLASYPKLAQVLKDNLQTDVPQSDLSAWVTLVQRVQKGGIVSLPFTNDVISTVNPDFHRIRALVRESLQPQQQPARTAAASPSASPSASATQTPRPSSSSGKSTKKVQAESISTTC
jgi:polyisoprenyl-teichoic acid--peptidoglycan teichoic acid transferase